MEAGKYKKVKEKNFKKLNLYLAKVEQEKYIKDAKLKSNQRQYI